MQSNLTEDILRYGNLAFELYEQFFPSDLIKNKHFAKIENLIVLPDGVMASIPLETLFTEKYKTQWTGWENTAYFSEMPFLIKKYNISYSYSATLFKNTFPKEKQTDIELTNINDWLAFAPVFDDNNTNGTSAVSRKLLLDLEKEKNENAIVKRSYLQDGSYVSPLPGTLDEVNDIFELFDKSGKKSKYYIKSNASEETVKSGELEKYQILHFATHGFVNTEKPELSGILMAQDTSTSFESYEDMYGNIAQQNDGILYQSEIYNMQLNADLVVLSACETGLGKITSGEGVIGLTRALLYAGTKNIIVSLWQVSDESTSQLMINFYKNLLSDKNFGKVDTEFGEYLRQAKLKMISEGKYAHPFYWSPFILIGK
jgi:CHAT domain-containing protein